MWVEVGLETQKKYQWTYTDYFATFMCHDSTHIRESLEHNSVIFQYILVQWLEQYTNLSEQDSSVIFSSMRPNPDVYMCDGPSSDLGS